MIKTAGIVCDNYKLNKFKSELKKAGFENIKILPLTKDTTTIQVTTEEKRFYNIQILCEEVEKDFQTLKN